MARRIPYTHFFDLLHKLLLTFGPILSIVLVAFLEEKYYFNEILCGILCVIIILIIIAYGIIFRAVPTFFYVLFKFGIKLTYKEMNYCHPLFSSSKWYPCDNLLSINKEDRKKALLAFAKEICHKYDGKTI